MFLGYLFGKNCEGLGLSSASELPFGRILSPLIDTVMACFGLCQTCLFSWQARSFSPGEWLVSCDTVLLHGAVV